jgi:hypothetical protein
MDIIPGNDNGGVIPDCTSIPVVGLGFSQVNRAGACDLDVNGASPPDGARLISVD